MFLELDEQVYSSFDRSATTGFKSVDRVAFCTIARLSSGGNNTLTHGKLLRCQTKRSDMQITAEIMQTYDLLKFAIARSNGYTLLIIPPYNTT